MHIAHYSIFWKGLSYLVVVIVSKTLCFCKCYCWMFQRIVWYLGLRTEADAVEFPCSKHKPINHKILIFKPLEFQKVFFHVIKGPYLIKCFNMKNGKYFPRNKMIQINRHQWNDRNKHQTRFIFIFHHLKWDLIIVS